MPCSPKVLHGKLRGLCRAGRKARIRGTSVPSDCPTNVLRRALLAATLLGACSEPPPPVAPSEPEEPAATWESMFDAARFPDIGGATRISQRFGGRSAHCIEGWRLRRGGEPVVLFDDLHMEWGSVFWDQWPQSQRVAFDRYADVPIVGRVVRQARVSHRRGPPPPFVSQPTSAFLRELLSPSCSRGSSGPSRGDKRLVALARARWAQMLGRPDIAIAQIEERPELFRVDDRLTDELTRVLTEQAKWGLSQGMPRRRALVSLQRAQDLARTDEGSTRVLAAIESLGTDPPPLPHEPTIDDLVAALPDDLMFPRRVWEPGRIAPTWWAPEGQQPMSPAWELVMRGWDSLPALRKAMTSEVWTRRFHGVMTVEGMTRLNPRSTNAVAFAVAAAITGRTFHTAGEFDAWWREVGVNGPSAAWNAALADANEDTSLRSIVDALVRIDDEQVWTTLAEALGDPRHERRGGLMLALLGDATPGEQARSLASRFLEDDDQLVRLASASVLLRDEDDRCRRLAVRRLKAEVDHLCSDLTRDTWWDAVDALLEADPERGHAVLEAAVKRGDELMREQARDWLEDP